MSITSTNYTSLHYDEETVPGTTNATPDFQTLPTTGGSPMGNISTVVSEVIRRDRQIDDLVTVDSEVGGTVNYELSFEPYTPMIEALAQNTALTYDDVPTDLAASDVDNSFNSPLSDFVTDGLVAGMHILVGGMSTAANNGVFLIESVATTKLVIDAQHTLVTETADADARITANSFRNGVATPKSFTFLKMIEGLASTVYMYYRGCQISSMSFNFETGSILNGGFNIVGFTEEVTETPIAGQTITDVPAYSLMNSVSAVSLFNVAGLPASTEFQSMNLNIDNNINRAKAIGTLGAIGLASFTLNATADVSVYFEDKTAYDAFIANSEFSVDVILQDGDGNYICIYLPKCKFETLESPIPGRDNFFMLNGTMRALRDATTNMTWQIDALAAQV